MDNIFRIHMGKAKCAVDLGDGSERGEYVSQDYIFNKLGRPHRGISLMYCYYPLDEYFPQRISKALKDRKIEYQWDYPYDDYFPYLGGLNGSTDSEPFTFMREIRRHGQEVILTLTIDPNVSDEHLKAIANDLRPFGRLLLRINHEATGQWFSFNKRCTYQQVADFYCRFNKIIHEIAPNVSTILCIGGVEDLTQEKITKEEEFTQAVRETDIWSVDKYLSLHWGYPCDVAVKGGNSHYRNSISETYEQLRASYERFTFLNDGINKPLVVSEFNADGDVTGPYDQADDVKTFYDMVKNEKNPFISGITMYQFRDRGRLGLEIQDANDASCGVETPLLSTYREIINQDFFKPEIAMKEELSLPVQLRWGSSEDAEGIAVPVAISDNPTFCELTFEDDSNLIIEFNGRWFYKSPNAKFIDLMPAFYDKKIDSPQTINMNIFAPPADGENDISTADGLVNYRTELKNLPKIRVEYAPVSESIE